MPDGWWCFGSACFDLAGGFIVAHQYLYIPELRQIFGDGVVQEKLPFLVEHHHGDGRDKFGLRCDAEDICRFCRDAFFYIAEAICFMMNDLAIAGNESDRVGSVTVSDGCVEEAVQPLESFGREARGGNRCGGFELLLRTGLKCNTGKQQKGKELFHNRDCARKIVRIRHKSKWKH